MATQKLTPWFPGETKPARAGVYQRKLRGNKHNLFGRWNGQYWTLLDVTVESAARWTAKSLNQSNLPWRGLAQQP